jgi:hypothetical protein
MKELNNFSQENHLEALLMSSKFLGKKNREDGGYILLLNKERKQ